MCVCVCVCVCACVCVCIYIFLSVYTGIWRSWWLLSQCRIYSTSSLSLPRLQFSYATDMLFPYNLALSHISNPCHDNAMVGHSTDEYIVVPWYSVHDGHFGE